MNALGMMMMAAALSHAPMTHHVDVQVIPPPPPGVLTLLKKGQGCNIISYQQAYLGPIAGMPGRVSVGIEHIDPENCGQNMPYARLAAFDVQGDQVTPINADGATGAAMIESIDSMKVVGNLITVKMLVFGPTDPACCARTIEDMDFQIEGGRLVPTR